jgi:hypothetical protein
LIKKKVGDMNYEELEMAENKKRALLRLAAKRRANAAYNEGLYEGLSFWLKPFYSLLKRPD